MSRNTRKPVYVLALLFAATLPALAASSTEIAWPRTAFANGLTLPALPPHSSAATATTGCAGSICTSPPDTVCGQCSIACPLGRASVCYPGARVTEPNGKEACGQRPACSCN